MSRNITMVARFDSFIHLPFRDRRATSWTWRRRTWSATAGRSRSPSRGGPSSTAARCPSATGCSPAERNMDEIGRIKFKPRCQAVTCLILLNLRNKIGIYLRSVVGHDVSADEQGRAVGHQACKVDEGRPVRGIARQQKNLINVRKLGI